MCQSPVHRIHHKVESSCCEFVWETASSFENLKEMLGRRWGDELSGRIQCPVQQGSNRSTRPQGCRPNQESWRVLKNREFGRMCWRGKCLVCPGMKCRKWFKDQGPSWTTRWLFQAKATVEGEKKKMKNWKNDWVFSFYWNKEKKRDHVATTNSTERRVLSQIRTSFESPENELFQLEAGKALPSKFLATTTRWTPLFSPVSDFVRHLHPRIARTGTSSSWHNGRFSRPESRPFSPRWKRHSSQGCLVVGDATFGLAHINRTTSRSAFFQVHGSCAEGWFGLVAFVAVFAFCNFAVEAPALCVPGTWHGDNLHRRGCWAGKSSNADAHRSSGESAIVLKLCNWTNWRQVKAQTLRVISGFWRIRPILQNRHFSSFSSSEYLAIFFNCLNNWKST